MGGVLRGARGCADRGDEDVLEDVREDVREGERLCWERVIGCKRVCC